MPLPRECPRCRGPFSPTMTAPDNPDAWIRGSHGEGWTVSAERPRGHEVASAVGFRCPACRKVYRLILARDR
jgi:hypothetical protein